MRTIRDNRATIVDCADVLFQVNGTSAQCCVAVKQSWTVAYCVAIFVWRTARGERSTFGGAENAHVTWPLKNNHEQICRPTVKKLQFQNKYAYIRKSERVCICSCTNDITARCFGPSNSSPSFSSSAFSDPAFSGLTIWSVIFQSGIFRLLMFLWSVIFQSRNFRSCIFSRPALLDRSWFSGTTFN